MAKAFVAEGQTCCAELKDMVIQQLVGSAGRVDYVEVSISSCWKWNWI